MFTAALTWFSSNIKWVVIGLGIIALSGMGYKLYNTIKENGSYQVQLDVLNKSLQNQQKIVKELEMDARLVQDTIATRDNKIEELDKQLYNLTNDLGPTASDAAPESIKELIRRLKKL